MHARLWSPWLTVLALAAAIPLSGQVCPNDAGEITQFANINMRSNSFGAAMTVPFSSYSLSDTIFVCYGDEFRVDLDEGSINLDGDPDASTSPGVVYGIYSCPPTVTGPRLDQINDDPCVYSIPGDDFFDGDLIIEETRGYNFGNYDLIIDEDISELYTNVLGGSEYVVFAPTTVDDLDISTGVGYVIEPQIDPITGEPLVDPVTGDTLTCMNVRTDQAFGVAFLLPIEIEDAQQSATDCSGSFTILGGVSEFQGSADYDISVTNATTGETATLERSTASYRNGDVVNYTVPEAGQYLIEITDGIGCGFTALVTHTVACEPSACNLDAGEITGFDGSRLTNNSLGGQDFVSYSDYDATDTIWLCAGDELGIDFEEGSEELSDGDPDPSTTPGITYFFYRGGLPTVTGTTIDDITDDPNFFPIEFNPFADPIRYSINPNRFRGEYGINIGVDVTQLIALFPGVPVFTMAPATANGFDLDEPSPVAVFEGEGDARCVNVSVDQAFTFGVLTPIEITDDEQDDNSCDGSFTVVGGVSRVRGTNDYTITIIGPDGTNVPTTNGSSFGHDDRVEYQADQGPGEYTITVTDGIGCDGTLTVTHSFDSGPTPCAVTIEELAITNIEAEAAGCGDEGGSITLDVSGGTAPYEIVYTRTDPAGFDTTENVATAGTVIMNDLTAGDYTVQLTDAVNATVTATATVEEGVSFGFSVTRSSPTCNGGTDGSLTAVVTENAVAVEDPTSNGYEIEWSGPGVAGATGETISGLSAGTYSVTVRESDSGCEQQSTISLDEPAPLEIANMDITPASCPEFQGAATIEAMGGTPPYTFRFVNDSLPDPRDTTMTFDTTLLAGQNTIEELVPDTNFYFVFLTDANGCVAPLDSFQVGTEPIGQVDAIATDSVSCPSSTDGRLSVSASPPAGETIESIRWFRVNPDGTIGGDPVAQGNTTDANLAVGAYIAEVSFSNECTLQRQGLVVSPGPVVLDSFTLNAPICIGDNNGSIFVYPSGGTAPYSYTWTDASGNTLQEARAGVLANLTAGTYNVSITDANNCAPFDTSFVLEEPIGIVGEFTSLTDVSCPDDETDDGAATFVAEYSDGTPGIFTFAWSTGDTVRNSTFATVDELTRGIISVTVTDAEDLCPRTFTDTIGSPPDLIPSFTAEDVSCNGQADGSITVNVEGGTPGYTYDWSDFPDAGNTVEDVAAGIYPVVVTDANGCVADTLTTLVNQPDELVLTVDDALTTPLVTCNGDADGVLAVRLASANNNDLGDNPYSWSDGIADSGSSQATDLPPGTYTVSVTDTEGCTDTLSYTIEEPRPVEFALEDVQAPLCFGETTDIVIDTAFGGQGSDLGDYTFTINDDGFLIPTDQPGTTFAGDITVTVFDSVGCSAERAFQVPQPEEIIIELPERIVVELGDSSQRLDPLITPEDGIYTFRWSPPVYLSNDSVRNPTIFPLDDQAYTLTVTNENGCTTIADLSVIVDANRNVFIPNIFSPNSDGRNEDWRIFACRGVVSIDYVRIYDRWGGLVTEQDARPPTCLDGSLVWNGQAANGEEAPAGVYVYVVQVTFLDNRTLVYRGDVTLVR